MMEQQPTRSSRKVPWLHGPLELIRHANGHLEEGGDTDRRIALIGFDNAIEVCIDVFLRLHPKLRGNVEIRREDVEKAKQNYHSKLEFLDELLKTRGNADSVAVNQVLWFHQLRNELYHSGNGMVPELHVIEGARTAALNVFEALFGIDPGPLVNVSTAQRREAANVTMPPSSQSIEMEFLRLYIDFERALRSAVVASASASDSVGQGVSSMWSAVTRAVPALREWDSHVKDIIKVRNLLVHGRPSPLKDTDLDTQAIELMEVTEALHRYGSPHLRSRP